jgi:hypothetical protein
MISVASLIALTAAIPWKVGPNLQLVWNDADYAPVGLQIAADDKNLSAAKLAGIQDFNLEVPVARDWKEAVAPISDRNYFITNNATLPNAKGIIVQPQYYRLTGVKKSGTLTVPLPGAEWALVVIAMSRDGSIIYNGVANVEKGVLRAPYKAATDADQIAIVYPFGESLEMEDLWSRLDARRDQVLKQVKNLKGEKGFRGLINPLGTSPYLSNRDNGFIPTDPMFRAEFEDYLEEKYRNLQVLAKAWGLRSLGEATDFSSISATIPLWNGTRGVSYYFNYKTNLVIPAESRKMQFWSDLAETISQTRVRRVHRILKSLRREAGVPILQEWLGWSWFFENPRSELTGITAKVSQPTPGAILASLAGAMSSNLRAATPGPLFATDVPFTPDLGKPEVLEDFSKVGVRGLFVRTSNPKDYTSIASMRMGSNFERPKGYYYPQNAADPAYTMKLGDGSFWLPAPNDGNRLQFGKDISGYQISDGRTPSYVIWRSGTSATTEFRLRNASLARFRSSSLIPPKIELTKTGFRITLDSNPVLVTGAEHPPIPDGELLRLEREIGSMVKYAQGQRKDVSVDLYDFKGFREILESNPETAFVIAQRVHSKLSMRLSNSSWIECENSNDNSFSEVVKDAGCSGGSYLSLRTPFADVSGTLSASVFVNQTTSQGMTVWLAAKIPNLSDKDRIKLRIGGQLIPIRGNGVSPYGSGFAWYNLGVTRLPAVRNEVRIEVNGVASTNVAFDCLAFTDAAFLPKNTVLPEFFIPKIEEDPKSGN